MNQANWEWGKGNRGTREKGRLWGKGNKGKGGTKGKVGTREKGQHGGRGKRGAGGDRKREPVISFYR